MNRKNFSEGLLWSVKGGFCIGNDEGQTIIELLMPEYNCLSHEATSKVEAVFLIKGQANHDG